VKDTIIEVMKYLDFKTYCSCSTVSHYWLQSICQFCVIKIRSDYGIDLAADRNPISHLKWYQKAPSISKHVIWFCYEYYHFNFAKLRQNRILLERAIIAVGLPTGDICWLDQIWARLVDFGFDQMLEILPNNNNDGDQPRDLSDSVDTILNHIKRHRSIHRKFCRMLYMVKWLLCNTVAGSRAYSYTMKKIKYDKLKLY